MLARPWHQDSPSTYVGQALASKSDTHVGQALASRYPMYVGQALASRDNPCMHTHVHTYTHAETETPGVGLYQPKNPIFVDPTAKAFRVPTLEVCAHASERASERASVCVRCLPGCLLCGSVCLFALQVCVLRVCGPVLSPACMVVACLFAGLSLHMHACAHACPCAWFWFPACMHRRLCPPFELKVREGVTY